MVQRPKIMKDAEAAIFICPIGMIAARYFPALAARR
jgi:hypothetical protein